MFDMAQIIGPLQNLTLHRILGDIWTDGTRIELGHVHVQKLVFRNYYNIDRYREL